MRSSTMPKGAFDVELAEQSGGSDGKDVGRKRAEEDEGIGWRVGERVGKGEGMELSREGVLEVGWKRKRVQGFLPEALVETKAALGERWRPQAII